MGRLLALRARHAWRAGWPGAAAAFTAGAAMQALLPVKEAWLPGVVAVGLFAASLGLALADGRVWAREQKKDPTVRPDSLPRQAFFERSTAAGQVAHALAVAALALGGLGAGLGAARLLGF